MKPVYFKQEFWGPNSERSIVMLSTTAAGGFMVWEGESLDGHRFNRTGHENFGSDFDKAFEAWCQTCASYIKCGRKVVRQSEAANADR